MIFENLLQQVRHKNDFHFNVRKIGKKFLAGTQYIDNLVIGCKEIGSPSIPILNTFKKLDFSFFISYSHMKTAPPFNTFDFFTINSLGKSGPCKIWPQGSSTYDIQFFGPFFTYPPTHIRSYQILKKGPNVGYQIFEN